MSGNSTSTMDEQQTISSIKEELSTLKSAFTGIQQDLHKVLLYFTKLVAEFFIL